MNRRRRGPTDHRRRQIAEVRGTGGRTTETHVQCQICRRWFQAVTYTHLRYKHGILEPQGYKDEFSVAKLTSAEVGSRIAESKVRVDRKDLEKVHAKWGKVRLSQLVRELGHEASTIRKHALSLGLPLLVGTWDQAKLIRSIRDARRRGEPLHSGAIRLSNYKMYKAASYHFGSWEKAIAAAGLSYARIARREPFETWSKPIILEKIRSLKAEGADLSYRALERRHSKLYAAARNHFGNWKAAMKAAEKGE